MIFSKIRDIEFYQWLSVVSAVLLVFVSIEIGVFNYRFEKRVEKLEKQGGVALNCQLENCVFSTNYEYNINGSRFILERVELDDFYKPSHLTLDFIPSK